MPSSLDALYKNREDEQCKELAKEYSGEKFKLIQKKGVYLYEYMDSIERLSEIRLPPKEAFYSKLNYTNISDEDYDHAKKVWNVFNCQAMRDYNEFVQLE